MPGAAVTVIAERWRSIPKTSTSREALMLRLEQARIAAIATGRDFPSPVAVLDKALAKAGLSRRERRQLIAVLNAGADRDSTKGSSS